MLNNKNSKATHSPKAKIATSLILATLLTSGTAFAASGDKVNKVINLSATIPSGTFTVEPIYGAWPSKVEVQYDESSSKFLPYSMRLEANTMTGLSAMLQQDAQLTKGSETVPLTVKLENTTLTASPQKISTNTTANTAQSHFIELTIEQTTAATTYSNAGVYTGVVNIVFEDSI